MIHIVVDSVVCCIIVSVAAGRLGDITVLAIFMLETTAVVVVCCAVVVISTTGVVAAPRSGQISSQIHSSGAGKSRSKTEVQLVFTRLLS